MQTLFCGVQYLLANIYQYNQLIKAGLLQINRGTGQLSESY